MIDDLLIRKLEPLFQKFNKFADVFIKFSFSKEKLLSNVKTKYALYKLNSAYNGNEIFEQEMTVEHIVPESNSVATRTIGNLILLEKTLNGEAGDLEYSAKKHVYAKSKSPWMATFLTDYDNWDETMFEKRARQMAKEYYEKVLGKSVE